MMKRVFFCLIFAAAGLVAVGDVLRDGVTSPRVTAISTDNSTTSTLGANAAWTGNTEYVVGFASLAIMYATDQAGTMTVQFSTDGTNWDDQHTTTIPAGGTANAQTFVIPAEYYRLTYLNGATTQTYFRVETLLSKAPHSDQHVTSNQSVSKRDDVTLTRPINDLKMDISRGVISDMSVIHKFGRNDAVGTTEEDIWNIGGEYTWQTNASLMEVVSSDANDTSAGSGAQTVVLEGLAADFTETNETISLNGLTASTGSVSFVRINRAYIGRSGTYATTTTTGTQAGNITIREAGGGNSQAIINNSIKFGQSQIGRYTVPSGKTAYIARINVTVEGSKAADVHFWQRQDADDVTTPFTPKRILAEFDGVDGSDFLVFDTPIKLPGKTDIWASADTTSGSTSKVDVEIEIILIDD